MGVDIVAFAQAETLCSATETWSSAQRSSSALTAGSFLLRRQKKVTKEKATPGFAVGAALPSVGCTDFPALLVKPGGCATRACGPQTVLADFPRLACVARRSTGGNPQTPTEHNHWRYRIRSVLLTPSASSSSAGRNGKKGEHCLSPAGASCAAPRCDRAAQSTRRSRATQRARLLLGYFFLARQEEVPRRSTAKPRVSVQGRC